MYENCVPSLRAIAVRILSQTSPSSACERNWFTFALIYTKRRNRLAYSKLEQLVYCYYNMKLKLRDMVAEKDKVYETDFMDLLQVATATGDNNENPFFDWVRHVYLDDDEGNPDPQIASHARHMRINVEQVIREEVGVDRGVTVSSSSDNQHTLMEMVEEKMMEMMEMMEEVGILVQEVGMLVQQVGMFVPEVGMLMQ
ncbi:hypothetical protein Dsin_002139 [Dipteronia sinensis]|uniref:HAT C-terminal dimerisation domain-containing protein n=1 Tax=Dipteronia sinensis TaxID=43782 RepID=A0AAE0EJ01_9ROSI|nr:hypothetical protein Dsin_002139 [Dipteronia sinensis]